MATTSCEAFSCRIDGAFDLIEDEKFDFDVPLSPPECDMYIRETSNDLEDEDEVFFGPIGHKERCVTVNSDLRDDESFKPMSPLNGEQIAELFKEATAVSIFLKSSSTHQSIDDDENNIFDKENNGICNILSQTFNVTDNSPDLVKESDLKITKSVSSSESVLEEDITTQGENSDVIVPTTPKCVLKEKNSEDQTITMQFPSPFIGRKARPRQNASKYATSKLPKTDMTLKTRSCFNSPIKVEHAYGVLKTLKPAEEKVKGTDNTTSSVKPRGTRINNTQNSGKGDSSFTESSSKLPVPSQSGIRPPGFGVQPRRRRTSSTSSSSTSSTVADLNDTFTVSKGPPTDISALPSVCPRKVPATKACLKPVNGTSGVPKTKFTKPQGRPQPVKALPQPGTSNKKAPPTPKSLGSTPGRSKSSLTSNQQLDRCQTPSSVKRSKSFTTPSAVRNKSTISTGQSVKGSQTPSKRKSEILVTPRTRGSTTATPRNSQTLGPTPVKRRGSAVKVGVPKVQTKVKGHRPSTPANSSCVSSSTETPPNPVPCKVTKRTSQSANAQKRRSFLPTPLRSDRITRSQSLRSRPGSSNTDNAPLPFNISPSAELVEPRRPAAQAPADHNLESLRSNSRLSDPFSPASQMTIVDPVQDSTGPIGGDAVVRNLIEWSPALPKEGTLIDI